MAQLYNVMYVATATAVTGSIAKVVGMEAVNTVDNISFGSYSEGGTSKITSNLSTNFVLGKWAEIDGPIYAFKSADTAGKFLVYFNAEY